MIKTINVGPSRTEILPPNPARLGYVITVKGGATVAFGYGSTAATALTYGNGNEIPIGGDRFVIADEIARLGVTGITNGGNATVAVEDF